MNSTLKPILAGALLLASLSVSPAHAQAADAQPVRVEGAWARASVQGQMGTGAFMTLTASQPLKLVGASSPVAGVTEVHEMKLEGDVMKMRPIASLDLPAGQPVVLRPGGHHLMLMDLKAPLAVGTSVPVTLRLRDAAGATRELLVQLPVSARAPQPEGGMRVVPGK